MWKMPPRVVVVYSLQRIALASLIRQFKPDRLLHDLTPAVADPALGVAGFHLYSFNEVRAERWRRAALARLTRQG